MISAFIMSKKLIKVLSHPNWSLLANSSYGYPRFILLMTAQLCQKAGQKKNAAEIYRRLAEFYGAFEPLEREFYLALTALCLDDKITALRHFEKAQSLNPADVNVQRNIEILRKQIR